MSSNGFAVDECVRGAVVSGLQAAGIDVLDGRICMAGWNDADILARCWKEKRILVSHDYDHGDLVFRDGFPAFGVILFAPGLFTGNDSPDAFELARQIGENSELYVNTVTIIGAKRIRRKMIRRTSEER